MLGPRGAALAAAPLLSLLLGLRYLPTAQTPSAVLPVAHPPAISPPMPVPVPEHKLDAADLTAFFDGIIPLQLERSDIAGASVVVMKDGNVLLEKGYGYADLKTKKPVDPAATIFRLASISKLFTWVPGRTVTGCASGRRVTTGRQPNTLQTICSRWKATRF